MTTITALPTPPSRDDPTNFSARGDAFFSALPTFVTQTNAVASETNTAASNAANSANTATTQAGIAQTKAAEAADSAASAVNAPGTSATSSTSMIVQTGSVSFSIQTGKQFTEGQFVVIASTASPQNYMVGQITAFTSGTGAITVNVIQVGGSGSFSAWNVAIASGISLSDNTWTGTQTYQSVIIETPIVANTGTAYTIGNRSTHDLTLTGNCTFTFPSLAAGKQFTLLLKQDATGSRTITWPASVRWSYSVAPMITPTAGITDVISFVCDGTYWLGFVAGQKYTRA